MVEKIRSAFRKNPQQTTMIAAAGAMTLALIGAAAFALAGRSKTPSTDVD